MKSLVLRVLPAAVAALVIAGCGGGNDPAAPAPQSTQLSGTAAVGAPVAGGDVSVTCGSAAAVVTTTGANGTWSVNVTSPTFPCLVAVTGGSLPAGTQLYGYATAATNVNVTPLTTLIGAYATSAANGAPLTQALLDAATAKVVTLLTDAGFTVPANPLTAAFNPAAGDTHDDLIEALMLTLEQQGSTLAEVVEDIAKDGEAETVAIVTPSVAGFDAIPADFPPNMPSYGPEAYSQTGLGDRITLQADTPRKLRGVTVAMSSWACQTGGWNTADCVTADGATFSHPITLNVYSDAGVLLATRTQEFTMPYRPSTDAANCTGGRWKAANGTCYNGKAFKITFDMLALDVTLPDTVRYEVAYNTRTHGPAPLGGATGPYDSLNVGVYNVATASPSVGTDPEPGYLLWNGALINTYDAGDPARYGVMAQFQVGQ